MAFQQADFALPLASHAFLPRQYRHAELPSLWAISRGLQGWVARESVNNKQFCTRTRFRLMLLCIIANLIAHAWLQDEFTPIIEHCF